MNFKFSDFNYNTKTIYNQLFTIHQHKRLHHSLFIENPFLMKYFPDGKCEIILPDCEIFC